MERQKKTAVWEKERVQIQAGPVTLEGTLNISEVQCGLVIFVHDNLRIQQAADILCAAGMSTLFFDLLTPEEREVDSRTRRLSSDISLLARRTIGAVDWIGQQPFAAELKLGLFGVGSATSAALIAAAERPEQIDAVVGQSSQFEPAGSTLPRIKAPMLLIISQMNEAGPDTDPCVLQQLHRDQQHQFSVIPSAAKFLEDDYATEQICRLTADWFKGFLDNTADYLTKNFNKGYRCKISSC